jgi:hypothetical protein
MRKIILICFSIISCYASFGQPIVNRAGASNTVSDARWQAQLNAFLPRYNDTASANLQKGIDSAGAKIYTRNPQAIWYRAANPKRWVREVDVENISSIINGSGGNISVLDSNTFVICNGEGVCDTFHTNINFNFIGFVTDSSVRVCSVDTASGSVVTICDTLNIGNQKTYIFQNGTYANDGIVEFGTNPLIHNTTLDARYNVLSLQGVTVYDYPYQFKQLQNFGVGTGIASFLSAGNGSGIDYNNTVRLGINYTSSLYSASPSNLYGYMGDKIGYMINTNLTGKGSYGLGVDNQNSKYAGIMIHTLDTTNNDAITFFGGRPPHTVYVADIANGNTLIDKRLLIIGNDGNITLPFYDSSTRTDADTLTKALGTDAFGHLILGRIHTGGGGTTTTVATSPTIIAKSNVVGGLSVNLPYIQDGGASSNLEAYDLLNISPNTLQTNLTDGIIAFNWKDSAVVLIGGCVIGPPSVDTVRISTDGGVTFTNTGHFNYNIHATAHVTSLDGYFYIIGGDSFGTTTQQTTVTRTNDFSTWQTMTTNAEFGARTLEAAWEWQGALFIGGGHDSAAGGTVYNDIWRSLDSGATWTIWNANAIASNGDTVMAGNAYRTVLSFNGALYKIMRNEYPTTFSSRCYKSLDGGLSWKRISDYPYSGVSYPSTVIWDGKIWVMNGFNVSNTSNFCYLDKTDTWHIYNNYSGNDVTAILTATHAGDAIVYQDKVLNILGNSKNDVWSIYRSNYSQGFVVKDTIRWGYRSFAGETKGGLELIVSNGGKIVPTTALGMVKVTSDNASHTRYSYNNGITFHTGISGASGTTYLSTDNERMKITNDGKVLIGTSTSDGSLLLVNGTAEVVDRLTAQSDVYFGTQSVYAAGTGRLGIGLQNPLYTLDVFSSSFALARLANSNISVSLGGDNTEFYFQPFTSSRGIGFYNSSGSAALQVLAGGGFKFVGIPDGGVAADSVVVVTSTGLLKKRDAASFGISGITADNGLTASTSTNVQLGGTLIKNTSITSATASYRLTISGVNTFAEGAMVDVITSGNIGTALRGETTNGRGVFALETANGTALYGNSTGGGIAVYANASGSGTGVYVSTVDGVAGDLHIQPSSTNTIVPIVNLYRESSVTGANGIGGSIDLYTRTTAANQLSNQIISKFTDATDATRTSQFIITGVDAATTRTLMTADGNGAIAMMGEGAPTITLTAQNSTGIGIYTQSTSGLALSAFTNGSVAGQFQVRDNSTNTILPVMNIQRRTFNTPANGEGASVDFYLDATSSNTPISNQLISKWTDATNATRTSQFSITGVTSSATETWLTIGQSGYLKVRPMTVTEAGALTPAEGMLIFVSNTNGTFGTIGFYGYQNGAWHAF